MKISVVVTSYNHEKYINQCIDSILNQKGNFEMEIILGDDRSTDRTGEILAKYQKDHPGLFKILTAESNLGITRNLKRCLDACSGDYIAICEGDDYWTDPDKLQSQMDLLEHHPQYSMCFSAFTLYYQEENRFTPFSDQLEIAKNELTIEDLLYKNYIGNFSCCMYRASVVHSLPADLFDMFTVDWLFNMVCGEIGKIGFIRERMSVYRKHSGGAWTGKDPRDQLVGLISLIEVYNKYFLYKYDRQFNIIKKTAEYEIGALDRRARINAANQAPEKPVVAEAAGSQISSGDTNLATAELPTEKAAQPPTFLGGIRIKAVKIFKDLLRPYWRWLIKQRNYILDYGNYYYADFKRLAKELDNNPVRIFLYILRRLLAWRKILSTRNDLLILDTIFPHPLSPFRYAEFTGYLEKIPHSMVFTTAEHMRLVDKTLSPDMIIRKFERENPQFQGKTLVIRPLDLKFAKAKLAYSTFLYNINLFIETLEKKKIPFIFTLYPGGTFEMNQPQSDIILNRVLTSPSFRKVIVTQRVTQEYLLSRKFCSPDQIEFIYGVVSTVPPAIDSSSRKHFGFEKTQLDICFVAYKYTERGVDKGYDVLIETAKLLNPIAANIHYHIVGNFNETDMPIDGLEGKITFYGVQKKEWLSDFFMDKDIILSPTAPFQLLKGQFDGFPTTSCTEAAFHEVAIFSTDQLNQNIKFLDREDIVIIPHEPEKIATIIHYYYCHPEKLRDIAIKGAAKVREIYSYENQMVPRIKVLKEELDRLT